MSIFKNTSSWTRSSLISLFFCVEWCKVWHICFSDTGVIVWSISVTIDVLRPRHWVTYFVLATILDVLLTGLPVVQTFNHTFCGVRSVTQWTVERPSGGAYMGSLSANTTVWTPATGLPIKAGRATVCAQTHTFRDGWPISFPFLHVWLHIWNASGTNI